MKYKYLICYGEDSIMAMFGGGKEIKSVTISSNLKISEELIIQCKVAIVKASNSQFTTMKDIEILAITKLEEETK